MLVHATCVAIQNKGVLLTGVSGVGKSDLALRLIDAGAVLVADDQVDVHVLGEALSAATPASIAGLIEVRHIGVMKLPYVSGVVLSLCVDLVGADNVLERLPETDKFFLLDRPLRRIRLAATAASTPAKIRATLLHPLVTDQP